MKRDYDPEEYAQFLEERKVVVEQQLQELRDIKEAKVLRKEWAYGQDSVYSVNKIFGYGLLVSFSGFFF